MTTTTPILYRICKRPAGDFAIQKVLDGCLVRFGLYRTRRAAEANLAIANVPHRPAKIIEEKPDAVGYAFAINGEINTADAYGSGILFKKLWNKLLDAAVLEAIAESHRKSEKPAPPVTADSIRQWFTEAELGQISDRQEVPPRVRVDTRRSEKTYVFDTCDHAFNDAVLHCNLEAM